MILALDVGNTQMYAGVFDGDTIVTRFRKNSRNEGSSDEFGVYLRAVLRESGIDPARITEVAISSVVPSQIHSLRGAALKYFNTQPFILSAGSRTKLRIRYKNPTEVGADRIANALGALQRFPGENLIIIDLGTATTFCAVTAARDYLGGTIVPGLKMSMEALSQRTAKLPIVEIVAREDALGRSTVESIQAGLFFGHLHAMRGISEQLRRRHFNGEPVRVVGTGGFSRLFGQAGAFDVIEPDLVLIGLREALLMNREGRNNEKETLA